MEVEEVAPAAATVAMIFKYRKKIKKQKREWWVHSILHCRSIKERPKKSLHRFWVAFRKAGTTSRWVSAFIREVYTKDEKQSMSVDPWQKCCGSRLRTPGINCTSSKLQKTQHFCSLHCLQSHEICRVV